MSGRDWVRQVWAGEGGAAGALVRGALAPAEILFRAASGAHHALYDAGLRGASRPALPTISVGNLRVGGSGKTPFAGWLVDRLLERGRKPALLHGGYAEDEPRLHALWHPSVPVFAGRDRAASAEEAVGRGCDVLVLDDAFQHRRLARDLDLVLVAAEHLREPVRLLPRGPWREPLSALRRADAVVVTRKTASALAAARAADRLATRYGVEAAVVWLRPGPLRPMAPGAEPRDPAAERVVAVAGIAEPELFFDNLRASGVQVAAMLAFPDHHDYDAADVARIDAAADGAAIATTAKDAVKLGDRMDRARLRILEQTVVVERGADMLAERIARVAP